jgi:hypothetical protein
MRLRLIGRYGPQYSDPGEYTDSRLDRVDLSGDLDRMSAVVYGMVRCLGLT